MSELGPDVALVDMINGTTDVTTVTKDHQIITSSYRFLLKKRRDLLDVAFHQQSWRRLQNGVSAIRAVPFLRNEMSFVATSRKGRFSLSRGTRNETEEVSSRPSKRFDVQTNV